MSTQFVGVQNSNLSSRSSSTWRPCTTRTTERGRPTRSFVVLVTRCMDYSRPSGQTLNLRVKEHKKASNCPISQFWKCIKHAHQLRCSSCA